MKKLIAVFLVLVLLPVLALADDAVGCWTHYELLTDGCPYMEMLYLSPDHTCFFLVQAFHADEPGLGRAYIGTWKLNADGTVTAKVGDNTSMTLFFSESYVGALDVKTGRMYVNIAKFLEE